MFNRLIILIVSTKNRFHVENLATMKKTHKIDFFRCEFKSLKNFRIFLVNRVI